MFAPTPREQLVDPQGRPYFLWDMEMTLGEFERAVSSPQSTTRSYLIGKLMRQAKPDDALQFVSPQQMADLWPSIERYLGKTRPFWAWLLEEWVDLIAEASNGIGAAEQHTVGRVQILVDSPRAILAEKLCALLERSELRDLVDVDALIRSGESLDVALADAPRRDGGFSPLALAWVLRDFDVSELALAAGIDGSTASHLDAFRQSLVERLIEPRSAGEV